MAYFVLNNNRMYLDIDEIKFEGTLYIFSMDGVSYISCHIIPTLPYFGRSGNLVCLHFARRQGSTYLRRKTAI